MGCCHSIPTNTNPNQTEESPTRALKFPSPHIDGGHRESGATIVRSDGRVIRNQSIIVPDSTSVYSPIHAYWLLRSYRRSTYGQVWRALLVTRENEDYVRNNHWTATSISCAVKEYSKKELQFLSQDQHFGEDPHQEIAAMQHLLRFLNSSATSSSSTTTIGEDRSSSTTVEIGDQRKKNTKVIDEAKRRRELMLRNNVLLPLDVFEETTLTADEKYLYLVTPFLGGGTMMERIQDISEFQAGFGKIETRKLITQIVTALETLHRAHICHFDLRLENILLSVEKDETLIPVVYGLGRCFGIPYCNAGQRHRIIGWNYYGTQVNQKVRRTCLTKTISSFVLFSQFFIHHLKAIL